MQTHKYQRLSIHACDTLKHNRNHMKRNVFHMCDLPCQGYQMLEFFAGKGNLSKCMKSMGYKTASFDILYSEGREEYHNTNFMDINSSSGYAYSVLIESIERFTQWQWWGQKKWNCFNLICVLFNHALFAFRCTRYTPLNFDWMDWIWLDGFFGGRRMDDQNANVTCNLFPWAYSPQLALYNLNPDISIGWWI